jgi:hypothetical protein
MTEETKQTKEKNILVVTELPKREIKNFTDDKNEEFELITIDEALTEIYKSVKRLERALI